MKMKKMWMLGQITRSGLPSGSRICAEITEQPKIKIKGSQGLWPLIFKGWKIGGDMKCLAEVTGS